jgi:sigma-E factor negative regulatory protein RseA
MNTKEHSKREQQLSAILDDDLDQRELNEFMQDLKRDPESDAESVKRYQMMGDVMRDELNAASFMDISATVHRAVDQELEYQTSDSQVIPEKVREPWFNLSAWTKPLAGMAIAASVAMVTVVSFKAVEMNSANDSAQSVAEINTGKVKPEIKNPLVVPVNPVIASQVRLASTADSKTKAQLQAKQLSDYMMRHSNSAGQSTMQGMVPYVRAVSFDSNTDK